MEAYNWQVIEIDGHNHKQIAEAIETAQADQERPTVIICNTTIGFGSPNKAGSHDCHGAPLGEDEVTLTKKALGLSPEAFHVPEEVSNLFAHRATAMEAVEAEWNELFSRWSSDYPDRFKRLETSHGARIARFRSVDSFL